MKITYNYRNGSIFLLLILHCIVYGGEPEIKTSSNYKYVLTIGGNYSDYATIDGQSKLGRNFGVYRARHLDQRLVLRYGFYYSSMKAGLKDQKLLSEDGDILFTSDIIGSFDFLEMTLMASYEIIKTNYFSIQTLGSIGYARSLGLPVIRYKSSIYNGGQTPFSDYDFRQVDLDGDRSIGNRGYVIHGGIAIERNQYHLEILYSYPLFNLALLAPNLPFDDPDEKKYSLSISFGISI